MELDPRYKGLLAEKWEKDFSQFIETGDASEEFLNYLDSDKGAQKAVEMAFTEQARGLEGLAEELKQTGNAPIGQAGAGQHSSEVYIRIAEAFEEALNAPEEKREEVLRRKATALTSLIKPADKVALTEIMSSLGNTLGKV